MSGRGQRSFCDRLALSAEAGMADGVTVIGGLPIPSTSPLFLAGVGVHVGLAAA